MSTRLGETVVVAAGLGYLLVMTWAIGNVSYDVWGALIVGPIFGALGVWLIRRLFRDDDEWIAAVLMVGMLIKLFGVLARYWVGFEAYGGGIDAGEYHRVASDLAHRVWEGGVSPWTLVPTQAGTEVVERFTASMYVVTRGSQLSSFITFGFLAYVGTVLFVKAAVVAVPEMKALKYAVLCVFAPSIVYWPSSVGKDALVFLGLGIASYAAALVFRAEGSRFWPALLGFVGLAVAGGVRPHMAAMWGGAIVVGLAVSIVVPTRNREGKRPRRITTLGLAVVALVALAALGAATLRYLEPDLQVSEDAGAVTSILEETTRRTAQAGSSFEPPSVSTPAAWPFAIVRTLTRPLPFEVSGGAQVMTGAEMAALLLLYALSWRSLVRLPKLLFTNAYVAFAVTCLILVGLAFSSFANLGILARQKSLVFPFLLLLACLPVPAREKAAPSDDDTFDERALTVGERRWT